MTLNSFIDTSVPPPPIGVPIPGLHFPASAKSPPLTYPTTTTPFHAQPPRPTKPSVPSPTKPKISPDLQPTHRSQPMKWKPDANGDHGSAFTSIEDSQWDNFELGGGYASPITMDIGLQGQSPVFVPKAANQHVQPSQGSSQNEQHFQTKKPFLQTRDATQGPKQWINKDKAKGRGIPKKDVKGPSASQFPKPQQGYNAFLQGYSTAPNGTSSSYQCHGSTKQQQDASKAALSKEQKKNEYEWQSFKIIRKVRKLLGGLKEDSAREKEIAAEIVRIMKAESSRLACFPWPKEQFVALDEIFGWAMDNSDLLDKACKVIQELHCLHPQNFQEDLLNVIMKRQSQYIKVSTATNKDKLYTTFCGLLTQLFIVSRSATNGLNNITDKLLDSVVNKWIMCDVQGTADDHALLTEVYASCLRALFVNIGPQLASSMDQRYNKQLRDQVLGSKPRFVKEAMLNLLLLRAADWQEEVFSKKNTFPEDQKEIPDTAQRCWAAGEGTEVSDEVNQKEALKVASVTTTSENLSKTDHTRPSAETASPTVSSITPKTQPDNLQATTAMSSLSLHSSNSNNSNSILNSADCQQNFKTGIKIQTSQPQQRPQSMQTNSSSDASKCLHVDNVQSNGMQNTEPLSSMDIYGPPYTSEDAAFRTSNDIPNATANIQERKLSSPSHVAWTATKPRSSPATGRGMMRFEYSSTSPLAFIQSGPPQDAAFKRYDSERLEKQTTTIKQLSSDYSTEVDQVPTSRPTQEYKLWSSPKSSQDCCEDRPDCMESSTGADRNTTEDLGKLGKWSNQGYSQDSVEEINDKYFASQEVDTEQFAPVTSGESNDKEETSGDRQTLLTTQEAVSKKDEVEGTASFDSNLVCQDPLASASNIPPEDSNQKLAPMVSDETSVGLNQYEQIQSTAAPGKPASPQVVNCSLCGSDRHRTRQCATFKKYAPHVKTDDCAPEETPEDDVQKPTAEKFGSFIFCSKCGQKGHLVYDCAVRGSFNIFQQQNGTSFI
ncbi:uncharacterized protein LOC117294472 [Asterias rubens]|uniref:uncharacterized protein LOC117294472 n=1 Tax=Asterias rubens TaxID=7604 RepID=UPI00145500E2|nr:uncharacterized protein LOC117294472 [Asterias rubens]